MPLRRRVGPKVAVLHKAIFEEGISIHFAHHVKVERIPCTGRSVLGSVVNVLARHETAVAADCWFCRVIVCLSTVRA